MLSNKKVPWGGADKYTLSHSALKFVKTAGNGFCSFNTKTN